MWDYDTAQICRNGHVINGFHEMQPQENLEFCQRCGSQTLTSCPWCKAEIRGGAIYGDRNFGTFRDPPAFCHKCGKPYPWTEDKLAAARALAAEIEELDETERAVLTASLDDLVRDTPQTSLAAVRFKKLAAKAGKTAAEGLKAILVDVVSEAAKKFIWP
jgi:hypothetical protein